MVKATTDDDPDPIDWATGGIETQLGWSLNLALQFFTRAGSVAVEPVPGGPRGYQVLVAITTESPTSQLLLGQRLGIDKNAMTAVVDALEAADLVQRRPDPADRRIRQVLPTPHTHAVLAAARAGLHDVESTLLHPLDTGEQQQLRRLLARVAIGLSDAPIPPDADRPDVNTPIAAPHRSDRRPDPLHGKDTHR